MTVHSKFNLLQMLMLQMLQLLLLLPLFPADAVEERERRTIIIQNIYYGKLIWST
jgi:hypothetical protein